MNELQKVIEDMRECESKAWYPNYGKLREWASSLEAYQQWMGEPVAWAEIGEDQIGAPKIIDVHLDPNKIQGEHRRLPLCVCDNTPAATTKGPVPGGEGCKSPGECKKRGFCMDGWHCTYIVPEWQRLKMVDAAEKSE